MTNATKIVQLLITKVLPWHSIQFLHIGSDFVEVLIANVNFSFNFDALGKLEVGRLLYQSSEEKQAKDFAEHLLGVLDGKVRNDAGELISN